MDGGALKTMRTIASIIQGLLIGGVVLAGCAGGYHPDPNLPVRDMAREAWLESWQDKHIDDVIRRYGAPDKSATLSDGGQVVEITKSSKEFRGGNYISGPETTYSSGTVYGSGGSARYSETTRSTASPSS
jgi:hypothetical protein